MVWNGLKQIENELKQIENGLERIQNGLERIQNGLECIENGLERIGNLYTLILTLYIFYIFGKLTMCRNEFWYLFKQNPMISYPWPRLKYDLDEVPFFKNLTEESKPLFGGTSWWNSLMYFH